MTFFKQGKLLRLIGAITFDLPRRWYSRTVFLVHAKRLELKGRFAEQEALCKRRLAKRPHDYSANYYLGRALRKQGKSQEAVEIYQKISQLRSSRFFMDQLDLIHALYAAKCYDEVLTAGQEALRKLTSEPLGFIAAHLKNVHLGAVHRAVGTAHAALGHYQEAIPHLQVACELDKSRDLVGLRHLIAQCREALEHGES